MDIRDAMAEAILRDVLANPGKYHSDIVEAARENEEIWNDEPEGRKCGTTWITYVEALEEHGVCTENGLAPSVPADQLPEQEPERDGHEEPDARDF